MSEDNKEPGVLSDEEKYALDFITSSAISRVNIKFLATYIPILWFSGMIVVIILDLYLIFPYYNWTIRVLFFPLMLLASIFAFIIGCIFFTKLFLVLVNLIHKPKEGVFRAEIGDTDFEFWCLRTEMKKLAIWFANNCPLPWIDALAFRWFGMKMDFSSHLNDAWVDCEFVKFGKNVIVGQGAVVMSSMVIGKYLIIKKVILDDYAVLGGVSLVAPGTIVQKDTLLGAASTTKYKQILDPGWVYFGIPAIKLNENKYAVLKKTIIKKDVDEERKYEVEQDNNIEE